MEQGSRPVSNFIFIADVTAFRGLSLSEYIEARTAHCTSMHKQCRECPKMLQVASSVSQKGFVKLKAAFVDSFSGVEYSQVKARRRLLQMPLACIRTDYGPGRSECVLIEYHHGVNYKNPCRSCCKMLFLSHLLQLWIKPSFIRSLVYVSQTGNESVCVTLFSRHLA